METCFELTRLPVCWNERFSESCFMIQLNTLTFIFQARPSSDMAAFREDFAKAKHIVVLTGAGVSAESGVPTFRGAGGFWRQFQAQVMKAGQLRPLLTCARLVSY